MRLRLFSCLLVMCAVLPAAAQDATPEATTGVTAEPTEARAFIETALTNFATLSGYHFAYETRTETDLSSDDTSFASASINAVEGDALANGDNHVTITIQSGESLDLAEATPPLHVERTVFNGVSALNFDLEDSVYADTFPFEEGWQSYEDLASFAETPGEQVVLDNLNNTPIAAAFLNFETFIEAVTEAEPEILDGVSMRVFDLELDALGLIIQNTPAEQRRGLDDILRNFELLAVSELSTTARLWVGAEDGQIYRGTIYSITNIPYFSTGNEDQSPYDVATRYTADFTISQHGEPIEIEPVILPE